MIHLLSKFNHSLILIRQYYREFRGQVGHLQRERLARQAWRLTPSMEGQSRSSLTAKIGVDAVAALEEFIRSVTIYSFKNGNDIGGDLRAKIAAIRFRNYLHFNNWNEDFLIRWSKAPGDHEGQWKAPVAPGMQESGDGTWHHPQEGIGIWLEAIHDGAKIPLALANEQSLGPKQVAVNGTNWEGIDANAAHRAVTIMIDGREEIAAYVRLMQSTLDMTVSEGIHIASDPRHPDYPRLLPCFQDFQLDRRMIPDKILGCRLANLAEMGRYNIVAATMGRMKTTLTQMLMDARCPKHLLQTVVSAAMKGLNRYLHAQLMHFGPNEIRWRETDMVGGSTLHGIMTFTVNSLTKVLREYGLPLVFLTDTRALSDVGRKGLLGGGNGYFTHQNGSGDGLVECNLIPRSALARVECNLLIEENGFRRLAAILSGVRKAEKRVGQDFHYGTGLIGKNTKHLIRDIWEYKKAYSPSERFYKGWRLYMKYSYDVVEQLLLYQSLQKRMVEAIDEVAQRAGCSAQNLTVLNAGSGSGPYEALVLEKHQTQAPRVLSLDFNKEIVKLAHQRISTLTSRVGERERNFALDWRFQALQADVRKCPVHDRSVDLVIATNVLYILRPDQVADTLRGLWNTVKPGGLLRCSMPFHTFANAPIQREHFQQAGFIQASWKMMTSAGKVAIVKVFNRDTIQRDIAQGRNLGLRLFEANGDCYRNTSPEEIRKTLEGFYSTDGVIDKAMSPMYRHLSLKDRTAIQEVLRRSGYFIDEAALVADGAAPLSIWVNFSEEIRAKIGRKNLPIMMETAYANQYLILSIWNSIGTYRSS